MRKNGTGEIRARYNRISPFYDLMELLFEKAGLHVVEDKNLFREVVKFVVANP